MYVCTAGAGGLPANYQIRSDCSSTLFPYNAGYALAETITLGNGSLGGCYPEANVTGTHLTYSAHGPVGSVDSITVHFGPYKSAAANHYMKIACTPGKTDGFEYKAIQVAGAGVEIVVNADCTAGATRTYASCPLDVSTQNLELSMKVQC